MRDIRSPIEGIRSPLRGFRTGAGVLWFGFNFPLLWGDGVPLRWGS